MKEKPTFYGIVPANVRYAKIADRAKLIFSEITALANKSGYCNASNGYFAQIWECDPSVISRHVSSLESIGAIRCEYVRIGKQVKGRKIYPIAMGGVLHPMQEGIAPDAKGVLHPMQEGIACSIKENSTRVNNTSNNNEEQKIKIELHDQIEQTKVEVHDAIKPTRNKFIQAPTIEHIIPIFLEKLIEKRKAHPQILDTWNWANHQAEKFWLHWDEKNWKIQKLNGAIATWINQSISYGTILKDCPVKYHGNPQQKQAQVKQITPMTQVSKQDLEERRSIFDNAFNKLG
jgi:Helix-turn-helix domain